MYQPMLTDRTRLENMIQRKRPDAFIIAIAALMLAMVACTTTNGQYAMALPRPPLKIPFPLDKAGHKLDVTFEVPRSRWPWRKPYLVNLIGLRVLFTTGSGEVLEALEVHPVTLRLSLSRLEQGQEVTIPLFARERISSIREYPRRYALFEIPEGKATATFYYADHSGAPQGTPDGSALVLNLAGARMAVTPGIYRFKVETLEDIPALNGVTSFFVYEAPLRG